MPSPENGSAALSSRPDAHPLSSEYRRFLIDAHVPDWDDSFLAKISPRGIAQAVASANASVLTVPSNNHAGLNFWPSSVGRSHKAIGDRDLLAEMLDAARSQGLKTVIYYALCYVGWYWEEHPGSRFVFADGSARRMKIARANGAPRFEVVCHNDPDYRVFALTQVRELARAYESDGFFVDMTMLPGPCYCTHCKDRFRRETGGEIPLAVDWRDAIWREYSSCRTVWLAEFAGQVANEIRRHRPTASIAHQSGAYVGDWWGGASNDLAVHTDWLSADVYSTPAALSFGLKLFNSLSRRTPADLLNSWTSPAIFEAVVPRTAVEMECLASIAVAHDAAFTVIDALNPDGSLYESNYTSMAAVFERVEKLEPFLGGELLSDVVIYRSFAAAVDDAESHHSVEDLGYPDELAYRFVSRNSHPLASVEAGVALQQAHIPFSVATSKDLENLSRDKVLVVSNVGFMSDEEIRGIRTFVHEGGRLYFSGSTPELLAHDALGEVLGVAIGGTTTDVITYVKPVAEDVFGASPFSGSRPMTLHSPQRLVTSTSDHAVVLATVTLPYTQTGTARYTSILSDPPGRPTSSPAIVENRFGRGRTLYSAGELEVETHSSQRSVFVHLIRSLLGREPYVSSVGDPSVEITVFERADLGALIIFALNGHGAVSSSRIAQFTVTVETGNRRVAAVSSLPDCGVVPFRTTAPGSIEVTFPPFSVMGVAQIEFAERL